MALEKSTWDKIKQGYIEGSSINQLANTYHVAKSTISVRKKNEHWKSEQQKANSIVRKKISGAKMMQEGELEKRTLDKPAKRAADNLTRWALEKEGIFDTLEEVVAKANITMIGRALKQPDDTVASQMALRAAQSLGQLKKVPETQINNLNAQGGNGEPLEIKILPVSAKPIN